ncbi:MAG TPA: LiaF domain-containing protein, partial [Bacteroidia bacterium]|nr:LiaF domain-containing protein [Bacteroidia bacterium]
FRGRTDRDWRKWQEHQKYKKKHMTESFTDTSTDDIIDGVTFMGGIKKKIISKNFKGGDITVIFGGVELNFAQADMTDKATLDVTQIFGGTKIIVPANWEIKSELVSVFGSIEDKRMMQPSAIGNENCKTLILKGTTFFGGIEIKSF